MYMYYYYTCRSNIKFICLLKLHPKTTVITYKYVHMTVELNIIYTRTVLMPTVMFVSVELCEVAQHRSMLSITSLINILVNPLI